MSDFVCREMKSYGRNCSCCAARLMDPDPETLRERVQNAEEVLDDTIVARRHTVLLVTLVLTMMYGATWLTPLRGVLTFALALALCIPAFMSFEDWSSVRAERRALARARERWTEALLKEDDR